MENGEGVNDTIILYRNARPHRWHYECVVCDRKIPSHYVDRGLTKNCKECGSDEFAKIIEEWIEVILEEV